MGTYRRTLPTALARQAAFRNYRLKGKCRIVATFELCCIHWIVVSVIRSIRDVGVIGTIETEVRATIVNESTERV
jgi:hypothetical protein